MHRSSEGGDHSAPKPFARMPEMEQLLWTCCCPTLNAALFRRCRRRDGQTCPQRMSGYRELSFIQGKRAPHRGLRMQISIRKILPAPCDCAGSGACHVFPDEMRRAPAMRDGRGTRRRAHRPHPYGAHALVHLSPSRHPLNPLRRSQHAKMPPQMGVCIFGPGSISPPQASRHQWTGCCPHPDGRNATRHGTGNNPNAGRIPLVPVTVVTGPGSAFY